jgi:hypothetical protein
MIPAFILAVIMGALSLWFSDRRSYGLAILFALAGCVSAGAFVILAFNP